MKENVSYFKYLGLEPLDDGETERDIRRRNLSAKRAITALNSVKCIRDIISKTKEIICDAIIESILRYGAET